MATYTERMIQHLRDLTEFPTNVTLAVHDFGFGREAIATTYTNPTTGETLTGYHEPGQGTRDKRKRPRRYMVAATAVAIFNDFRPRVHVSDTEQENRTAATEALAVWSPEALDEALHEFETVAA